MQMRFEDGENLPAINVKIRHHISLPKNVAKAMANRDDYDDITRNAFEDVQREWWQTELPNITDKCLKSAFKGWRPSAFASGRSAGWVVVRGLEDPEEWNAKQNSAWDRFEKAVKKSMKVAEKFYIAAVKYHLQGGR